ncbi:MAG: hypothetical protein ACRCT1_11075 [Microcoleaceae cyanobacterium]
MIKCDLTLPIDGPVLGVASSAIDVSGAGLPVLVMGCADIGERVPSAGRCRMPEQPFLLNHRESVGVKIGGSNFSAETLTGQVFDAPHPQKRFPQRIEPLQGKDLPENLKKGIDKSMAEMVLLDQIHGTEPRKPNISRVSDQRGRNDTKSLLGIETQLLQN